MKDVAAFSHPWCAPGCGAEAERALHPHSRPAAGLRSTPALSPGRSPGVCKPRARSARPPRPVAAPPGVPGTAALEQPLDRPDRPWLAHGPAAQRAPQRCCESLRCEPAASEARAFREGGGPFCAAGRRGHPRDCGPAGIVMRPGDAQTGRLGPERPDLRASPRSRVTRGGTRPGEANTAHCLARSRGHPDSSAPPPTRRGPRRRRPSTEAARQELFVNKDQPLARGGAWRSAIARSGLPRRL